ncbi:MAG: ParB/RepB/Spo0J family partition protein [Porticoccaceae bacterium]
MNNRRKGLGRGLDALLGLNPDAEVSPPSAVGAPGVSTTTDKLRELPVEFLRPGKYQPRRDMHPAALEELAESIRQQGIMQPVTVRPLGVDRYEIIAGERRWRAAQMAGLATVPALVRDVPDQAVIAMALIENIQREDLNAMEEARALTRLQEEFGLTQQQVAQAVGKPRATVANLMRLTGLEAEVSTLLEHGDLEMGHGRALLGLTGKLQIDAARLVSGKGMTVRQTEALVRQWQRPTVSPANKSGGADADIKVLVESLSTRIGAAVDIQHGAGGKGKLIVRYNSLDELEGILAHIR